MPGIGLARTGLIPELLLSRRLAGFERVGAVSADADVDALVALERVVAALAVELVVAFAAVDGALGVRDEYQVIAASTAGMQHEIFDMAACRWYGQRHVDRLRVDAGVAVRDHVRGRRG